MGLLFDDPKPARRIRPTDPNWNHHWTFEEVEYASKTQLMKELKINNKQWHNIIVKAYKEKLQLRGQSIENSYNRTYFTVYAIDDVKEILKELKV